MWAETWRDVRLAVRTLTGSPMFTLTAMLSLAIGIGGTAVIFGVADAYLFRPWPGIADPDRLVEIGRTDADGPGAPTEAVFDTFSYPNYQDYSQRQTVFQSLAANRTGDAVGLGDGTSARRVAGAYVTTNYFSVLGTPMALGRTFVTDDMVPSAARRCRHHQSSAVAVSVRWRPNDRWQDRPVEWPAVHHRRCRRGRVQRAQHRQHQHLDAADGLSRW